MIKTFHNEPANRFIPKTSQQLFRRIDVPHTRSQSRLSKTSKGQRSFPNLNSACSTKNLLQSGKSLDNSKENLMFENFLQKVKSASRIDEKSIVGNYLNSLRKDYDKMHKQTKQQLSSITLKKKDIEFIKQRVKLQQQSMKNLDKKLEDKLQQLQGIRQKQQQVQTERKTLDHIIFRMKKDEMFYKQFGRVFEGYLNEKRKTLKSINENILVEDQKIHKLLAKVQNIKLQLHGAQQFRQKKIQDYYEKLQNIQENQMFIQERKQRTLELQSIESNDILKAKNQQMRNICLINKVAESLFESKMQRLIATYSHIQKAFHTIQVKTSINDPTLIADKFFSYGQLTENLMRSISNYEKILQEKTKQNEKLKQQLKKVEELNNNNEQLKTKNQNQSKLTFQQLIIKNERHLIYDKITDWIERQAKKIKINQNQNYEDSQILMFANKFIQICNQTKFQTDQLEKTFKNHQKYITPGIRIKKLTKESHFDFKNQKNKDTTNQIIDQHMNEDQFFKVSRANVKRNFMIKQRTINLGNISHLKQTKNQERISDRKMKTIEDF